MRSKQLLWILVFLVCLSSAYALSTSGMGNVEVKGWLNVSGITNVTTICITGVGCIDDWAYVNSTGGGGNTSNEIFAVVDNGTFLYVDDQRYNYTSLLGGNSSNEIFVAVDNGTFAYYDMATSGNTTGEIFAVVDNGTFIYLENQANLNVNSSNFWDNFNIASDLDTLIISHWDNITNKFLTAVNNVYIKMSGTTIYLDESELNTTINIISKDNANTSDEIFTVVDNDTFLYIEDQRYNETNLITGNTSAELFEVIDNNTWLYLDDQRYNDSSLITGNSSNEIFTVVDNGTFAYWDMATSGNTTEEIWVVVDNDSFMLIDASVGNTTDEIFAAVDNGTFLYTNDQRYNYTTLLGGNTSDEIFNVVDNGTFAYYDMATSGNTTGEIFTVVDNGTFIYSENQSNINVNSSNFWDDFNIASDLDTLVISHWDNITNKFITAVNNVYLKISGTTIYFDEEELNITINTISKGNANTSDEIFTVVDNLTFAYKTEATSGNTSNEIFIVVDNNTFLYIEDQRYNYTTLLGGNSSDEIFVVVDNGTFAYYDMATSGNTTNEIFTVVDNDTFLYVNDQRYNYTTLLGGNSSDEIFTVVDNLTFAYKDEATSGNTSLEIWVVIDNETFLLIDDQRYNYTSLLGGNSTNEIWAVIDNDTFMSRVGDTATGDYTFSSERAGNGLQWVSDYGASTDGSLMLNLSNSPTRAWNAVMPGIIFITPTDPAGTYSPGLFLNLENNDAYGNRLDMGWGGAHGGNFELYSENHDARPGEFRVVYGGGAFGHIQFTYYDGSNWWVNSGMDENGRFVVGVHDSYFPGKDASTLPSLIYPFQVYNEGKQEIFYVTTKGDVVANGTLLINGTGDNYILGNLSIGATSPNEKLSVTGNINATGIICDSSGCIGEGIGDGNSSLEIWTVVDNGTFAYAGSSSGGNSSAEIFIVVDNNTFSYANQDCGAGNFLRSDTNGVWTCAADNLGTGNSSNEIFAVVDNGTFLSTNLNASIGKTLTFAFGEFIDNLIDGIIGITANVNITGNLNVSGNAYATKFYEDGESLEDKYEPKSTTGETTFKFSSGNFMIKVT